ncbi:hypothetical protein Bbelb_182600 [Branchiostoma belcheri]|nr:hypothetical protein Bbelb_182600 [Branchiostoma belcheri]
MTCLNWIGKTLINHRGSPAAGEAEIEVSVHGGAIQVRPDGPQETPGNLTAATGTNSVPTAGDKHSMKNCWQFDMSDCSTYRGMMDGAVTAGPSAAVGEDYRRDVRRRRHVFWETRGQVRKPFEKSRA